MGLATVPVLSGTRTLSEILLRLKHNVRTLSEEFGHKTERLVKEAEALGLVVTEEDRGVFSIMGDSDAVIEVCYIRTGYKQWPSLEALSRTSENIRNAIGTLLRKADVMVRL